MISTQNVASNSQISNDDFTAAHYRELVRLALRCYPVANYVSIPWASRFVLWRHDLDYSLNRGLVLAKVEHEEGLSATYFINPHSEFYNIAEVRQHLVIQEILSLGHDIGLHFDAAFYGIMTEQDLARRIAQEADYLHSLFGVKPVAFSFHNPAAAHLVCEADHYGGLVNCYSKRFKTEVAYCSDSNGYWRFRRLHSVLTEAKDNCLQVLTHPGWWQDTPIPPRQRIFRSSYGRAAATMRAYDASLELHGRLNHVGAASFLQVFKSSQSQQFELCDYLWNQGLFQTLFMELWRAHEAQINRLCNAYLCLVWQIPAYEVNAFFREDCLPVDGWELFSALFEQSWPEVAGMEHAAYQRWVRTRNQIILSRSIASHAELETGCVALCQIMQRLAEWGKRQAFNYDGLEHLRSVGLSMYKTSEDWESSDIEIPHRMQDRWDELKKQFRETRNSND